MSRSEFLKALNMVKTLLEDEKNWGIDDISMQSKSAKKDSFGGAKSQNNAGKKDTKSADFQQKVAPYYNDLDGAKENKGDTIKSDDADKISQLEVLKIQAQNCRECDLGYERLNCVFGSGNPNAQLMFVGEGPGFKEDHEGLPFIGRAGELLTKIIEAMGYKREQVYITNIVKCHPMKDPTNPQSRSNDRPPTPEESACCKKFLDQQIEIIQPKIIVALGAPSAKLLLQTQEPISALRGKFFSYKNISLMPTYHPAALLRNPSLKKDVWKDMQAVMKFLQTK